MPDPAVSARVAAGAADRAAPAGWYGKLACLGDFASRRLSREFIERWDGWLQQVLAASRAQLGQAWLQTYLTSPVWRFVEWTQTDARPGAAGAALAPAVSVGVLMPSVDKVGRYFPLCVAASLPGLAAGAGELQALLEWLDRIEAVALATLDTGRRLEQFDDALLAAPPPLPQRTACTPLAVPLSGQLHGAWGGLLRLPSVNTLAETLMELGQQSLAESARGATLWWVNPQSGLDAPVFACRGLPDAAHFTAMLCATATPARTVHDNG
jgi:type VI secretion system protein ImpM